MALWLARQCQDPPTGWACPTDSTTNCVCNAGYYGPGGDLCTTCDAGSWCPGGTTITACAANTNSAAGSDAVTDCVCNAGYYGPGGDSCATCDAGSWCPGGATITPCPDHMISAPGSDSLSDCTCKEGYSAGLSVEGALCEATDVSREVSTITLAVTLSMSASEFNSQMRRSAYIDGVARALKVESSAVQIKSVQEQSSERRLRLLATTCLVETTVTVRSSIISVVRSRATVENLNAALAGNLNAAVVSAVRTLSKLLRGLCMP